VQEYRLDRKNYWCYDQTFNGPIDSEKKMDALVENHHFVVVPSLIRELSRFFAFSKRLGVGTMLAYIY
jgi:hypothetical protein